VDIYWDSSIARFRRAGGQLISAEEVRLLSQRSIEAAFAEANSLASRVFNGSITVPQWQVAFREEIKKEYIRQYLVARGGRDVMEFADWGSCGGMIGNQFRYLDCFAADIAAGKLTETQIQWRSRSISRVPSKPMRRRSSAPRQRRGILGFLGI